MDRVRNEEVSRRAGIQRELASRADQRVFRWFGHVERMDEYRMAKRVLMAEVSGPCVLCSQGLLSPVFSRIALLCSGGYNLESGGMQLYNADVVNCKKGATTENQG